MNMSSVLISGGIAATLVFYGRRWLRAAETRADRGFRDVVIEAAAEWMSQHEGGDRDGHAHRLTKAIAASAESAEPGRVLRIDYTLTKESADEVLLTVNVLVHEPGAGAATLGRSERVLHWDEVPQEIRAAFIRAADGKLAYVLYERPSAALPAGP